jgi:hypothetical protein
MSNELKELVDGMCRELYGIAKTDATDQGICVMCKEQAIPKCYSEAGRKEYRISGLCEPCFDTVTGGGEE